MLPIAVLPIAGLLLRLGQPDLLDSASVAAAGEAIFSNLGLLFAIGVAVGLARENHGAAGLASVVAYLVATKGAEVLIAVPVAAVADVSGRARELAVAAYKAHELAKLSVPVGILSGLTAGALYNRFYNINLPSYLAFFGGRRFVPIASGFAGLLASIALTSMLTGVTEPIEFTFIFLAPVLYAVHALLTGVAFIIMNALGVRLGFGFSAGLFDYVLNFSRAARPLWLLPVGALYFALYYGLFRRVIVRFDLKTPGRDALESAAAAPPAIPAERARVWISALGGAANLVSVDACTTRLRLMVADQAAVDEGALKRLGVRGVVRPSANALQVVVGAIADQVAGEIRSALHGAASSAAVPAAAASAAAPALGTPAPDVGALLAALGGRANVLAVEA